ncbi:MAG TPA: dehydrogenase [Saprospiraceae bacterium]|nr:dehydrogenase [Saprospiraceae bacterium]
MKDLYHKMLWPRLIEEKMINLLRQGQISKWFSGIGQEAIPVGITAALAEDDFIFPMHRNLGVFTTRQVPFERLLSQWLGKGNGFTNGRDRSFHFGAPEYGIVGMISHLGPQLSLADGSALAFKLKGEKRIAVAFTGDGGTSQGEFHEALNVASVWNLPVIFVVEHNGYGLSTPNSEQFKVQQIADRAIGYGMESMVVEGNNILEVYKTVQKVAADIRENPRPVLLEFMTFRMFGHEMASGTKYVPKDLLAAWKLKDPIHNYEQYLLDEGLLAQAEMDGMKKAIKQEIQSVVDVMHDEPDVVPDVDKELEDVYAPYHQIVKKPGALTQEMRFVDAIAGGMDEAMKKHSQLVLMGQDIAGYGGVFKVTDGLMEKYGADRVRNTPLCESAILGAALGLSIQKMKAMVEMQFADFVTVGFNQIVNNLAKVHYRWGQNADVVVRMPTGAGMAAGPFHSQSNEAWFTHTPGLKVLYPSNPQDAKGMLLAAFEDPNPILFFEHKGLYRSIKGEVPEGYYTTEIGKATTVKTGSQAVIITYGMGVHWAKKLVDAKALDVEILDLRTLLPLDYEAIDLAVKKTNRVLLLHEDTLIGGIGGELSAYISENLFEYLDAPIVRVASLDTPIPFAAGLEKQFLAESRLEGKLMQLLAY